MTSVLVRFQPHDITWHTSLLGDMVCLNDLYRKYFIVYSVDFNTKLRTKSCLKSQARHCSTTQKMKGPNVVRLHLGEPVCVCVVQVCVLCVCIYSN